MNHLLRFRNVVFLSLALTLSAMGQPQIISVFPNTGLPGQTLSINIQGSETHFAAGVSLVDFGADIAVLSTQVNSATNLMAEIRISAGAATGDRQVTVTTAAEVATLDNAFTVEIPDAQVLVQINVIPVSVLYLSDLNPTNLGAAPLLFTVTLTNNAMARDLRVKLTVSSAMSGDLVIGIKDIDGLSPAATLVFNNREFDDYSTTSSGEELLIDASRTGRLPADTYTYRVEVLDANGNLLSEDEGENTTTNPTAELELIGPGTAFGDLLESVASATPQFQWLAAPGSYDIAIYPVLDGQTSPENVVENRPVFRQSGLTSALFTYPGYAEYLTDGQTYAWQVIAHISTSRGEETQASEVFWFRRGDGVGGENAVDRLEITPPEALINGGETVQFRVQAYNATSQPVSVTPEWRVVPAEGGTITAGGVFSAAQRPGSVAVVARVGEVQEYALVTVEWDLKAFDIEALLKQLFGLPDVNK